MFEHLGILELCLSHLAWFMSAISALRCSGRNTPMVARSASSFISASISPSIACVLKDAAYCAKSEVAIKSDVCSTLQFQQSACSDWSVKGT
jgi:hypothetical protein